MYVVHGSASDPLFGSVPEAPDVPRLRLEFMSVDTDFVVVGHTHSPMVLRGALDGAIIVNPGSVGLPMDGDPRASYALLDLSSGAVHPRRVAYDVGAAVAAARAVLPRKEASLYEGLLTKAALR
jgi:diadenosine tetraphosphatase ApaH/serine/threonine PP2A family protein phosphatase